MTLGSSWSFFHFVFCTYFYKVAQTIWIQIWPHKEYALCDDIDRFILELSSAKVYMRDFVVYCRLYCTILVQFCNVLNKIYCIGFRTILLFIYQYLYKFIYRYLILYKHNKFSIMNTLCRYRKFSCKRQKTDSEINNA